MTLWITLWISTEVIHKPQRENPRGENPHDY